MNLPNFHFQSNLTMQDEDKDRYKDKMLKYLELPTVFRTRANDIDIDSKVALRKCHELAKNLSRARPKTPEEFERVEVLKALIVEMADLSEAMVAFLRYMDGFLQDVMLDAKALCDGADLRNKLLDQSDTILILMEETKTIR